MRTKIFTSPTTSSTGRSSGLGAPSGHAFPQLRGSVAAHFFWSFLSVSSTGPSGLVCPDLRGRAGRPKPARSQSTPEPAWRPGRRIPRFLGGPRRGGGPVSLPGHRWPTAALAGGRRSRHSESGPLKLAGTHEADRAEHRAGRRTRSRERWPADLGRRPSRRFAGRRPTLCGADRCQSILTWHRGYRDP